MQPTPPPIEFVNVAKRFGNVEALADISFRIAPGERVCLLGSNGAGKTTTIRLLMGALQPTHGAVHVFGSASHDRNFLDAKRRMGVVPQAPGMYREMTVAAYLRFVRNLYGKGHIAEVVLAFGLQPYLDRPLAHLSGGVQRRVLLAGALLPKPDLLLLDEPTANLDPLAARDVHAYLQAAMVDRTMLLCTHNLAEAEALCDSVVVLRQGRVLLHSPLAELRERVQPCLRLAAAEGVAPLVEALRGFGCEPTVEVDHAVLPVANPQRDAPLLLRRLLAAGLNVYACQVQTPSLEELFVDLLGPHRAGYLAEPAPSVAVEEDVYGGRPQTPARAGR